MNLTLNMHHLHLCEIHMPVQQYAYQHLFQYGNCAMEDHHL